MSGVSAGIRYEFVIVTFQERDIPLDFLPKAAV